MTQDSRKARPTRFGVILYPQFEVLDVFGPLEALNTFSRPIFGDDYEKFSLSIISSTLDPVYSMPNGNPFNQSVVPTHTFTDAPPLDVLLVPGGLGSGDEKGTEKAVEFIKERYLTLQSLITVCTGADLAARAGVLDGKRATTNKRAWKSITSKQTSRHTYWVAKARWVVSGNIWTTSGVSAGTDGMLAWIKCTWGAEIESRIRQSMEYEGTCNPDDDPFAASNDAHDVPPW